LNVPEEYWRTPVDYTTFAMIFEELTRGWMALAGIIGSHLVLCDVLVRYGTDDQKRDSCRVLARASRARRHRAVRSRTPARSAGDRTVALRDGAGYRVTGSKMWVTNGAHGRCCSCCAKTDPQATPPHRGMSAFVVEKGAPA
jgi:alkylation response protein AidB-like acyl-CoA dehydrogenase